MSMQSMDTTDGEQHHQQAVVAQHLRIHANLLYVSFQCNKIVNGVFTPLLVSIYAPSLKCVKLLIKAGADVNGVGNVTPLIADVSDGLTDCMKCLLEAGADPDVPDAVHKQGLDDQGLWCLYVNGCCKLQQPRDSQDRVECTSGALVFI